MFPFALVLPFAVAIDFFAFPVGPCLPIVGRGTVLLDFAIFGAGTLGGTAKVKGVFAGVEGGVGGRPTERLASLAAFDSVSRGLRNMTAGLYPSQSLVCRI